MHPGDWPSDEISFQNCSYAKCNLNLQLKKPFEMVQKGNDHLKTVNFKYGWSCKSVEAWRG